MGPAQGCSRAQVGAGVRAIRCGVPEGFVLVKILCLTGRADTDQPATGGCAAAKNFTGEGVILHDDGGVTGGHQPFFNGGVIVHRAVAVDMVGGQIEQHTDAGVQRGGKVNLETGTFNHMHAVGSGWLQRQNGRADIAAKLHIMARPGQNMGDQGGGGGFAIGAGDGNKRRAGGNGVALAAEQLNVANNLDMCRFGPFNSPVGLRMRQRHTGGEHKSGKAAPVRLRQIDNMNAGCCGFFSRGGGVIPCKNTGATGLKRPCRHKPRTAKAEESDCFARKHCDRSHIYLSFSEARPISASTTETIQNLTTT